MGRGMTRGAPLPSQAIIPEPTSPPSRGSRSSISRGRPEERLCRVEVAVAAGWQRGAMGGEGGSERHMSRVSSLAAHSSALSPRERTSALHREIVGRVA